MANFAQALSADGSQHWGNSGSTTVQPRVPQDWSHKTALFWLTHLNVPPLHQTLCFITISPRFCEIILGLLLMDKKMRPRKVS